MAPAPKFSMQEQEDIILNAAANCIEKTSLLDFTMSAVAKEAAISMGSIYKHVQCKEDIIFALAIRVFKHYSMIFKEILELPLTTPERIMGITLLNPMKMQLYPFDTHLDAFVANELVVTKTSPLWTERMISAHQHCEEIFYQTMKQAVQNNELICDDENEIEAMIDEINLGGWSLTVGYQNVERITQIRQIALGTAQLHEPVASDSAIVRIFTRLINSYQWQTPLDKAGIEKTVQLLIARNLR
ncbi:hypothetical protein PULV_b0644 [Pseudoalteromonas ulvae UL12]|uniref:TetR family transcriptional regulator n=1 Tax=Pseudoalteromonas ulvae TaxID=107327 RepID=A0A244CT36_PSEDV|nr:TetR/AcrR family transcriptional regulator [Pseudoalteromonas ulvae]MBE0365935.1 hypothetical protein [Pseudoalteromonas ulvae UL12]OUL58790.1 TetR family transcriptional regulator [Pseudoalteromonas ulvae]